MVNQDDILFSEQTETIETEQSLEMEMASGNDNDESRSSMDNLGSGPPRKKQKTN